jgi:hypothetical protein
MAVTKTVIRNTHQETVVKVAGTSGSATIDLQTDIVAPNQVLDGATQTATIVGVGVTGLLGSAITITRNGVNIMTFAGENSNYIDFGGQALPPESSQSSSDIVVTIAGAEAQCWLKLRKTSGYKSTSGEYQQYGAYEDETRVGASTTLSGSPDKV